MLEFTRVDYRAWGVPLKQALRRWRTTNELGIIVDVRASHGSHKRSQGGVQVPTGGDLDV
jgi:hypothetical protein